MSSNTIGKGIVGQRRFFVEHISTADRWSVVDEASQAEIGWIGGREVKKVEMPAPELEPVTTDEWEQILAQIRGQRMLPFVF